RRWTRSGSTSPSTRRSIGRTPNSERRTSSSRWAVAMPVRTFPASAIGTGNSTIRPADRSRRSDTSATPFGAMSNASSTSSFSADEFGGSQRYLSRPHIQAGFLGARHALDLSVAPFGGEFEHRDLGHVEVDDPVARQTRVG